MTNNLKQSSICWAAIIILAIGWGLLMAHGCEKQYAEMDKAEAMAYFAEPVKIIDEPFIYYLAQDSGVCEMSYYSSEHGCMTAYDEIYDSLAMTCAIDMTIPLTHNDVIEISYKALACTLRVNDRMSPKLCNKIPERDIDISQAAARKMNLLKRGISYMKWRRI